MKRTRYPSPDEDPYAKYDNWPIDPYTLTVIVGGIGIALVIYFFTA